MTKIKLFLQILINLVLLFSTAKSAHAVNLKGEWTEPDGLMMKAEQTGNTFSFVVTDPDIPEKYQGIANLKGTIGGSTFTGQIFSLHLECPNLDGYRPASGTISSREIKIKAIFSRYDTDACTIDLNTETEISVTYTKILSLEEQALDNHQKELAQLAEDLANRSGPVIDTSTVTVVSTSPIAQSSERYPVNVGADTRPDPSTYIDYLGQVPNVSASAWDKEIARVSNFEGDITRHRTVDGKTSDYQIRRVGTSIKGNVLNTSDTFSFKGDGFIQYHGVDGSIKQFMTGGYAKKHGFADQIKPGQAGVEIILKPAEPPPTPVPPPGPIRQFFNWLGELMTPEPQPTTYGIVGVKG